MEVAALLLLVLLARMHLAGVSMIDAANDDFRVRGIGRDGENERVLCLYLSRRATDDEMRRIHELLRDGIPATPLPLESRDA